MGRSWNYTIRDKTISRFWLSIGSTFTGYSISFLFWYTNAIFMTCTSNFFMNINSSMFIQLFWFKEDNTISRTDWRAKRLTNKIIRYLLFIHIKMKSEFDFLLYDSFFLRNFLNKSDKIKSLLQIHYFTLLITSSSAEHLRDTT